MLMLTAATSNAAGLLAVRFLLGVCESPIAPGLTVIVAMWYKRSEQPLRHAAWFLGNTTAGVVGGLTAYGIGHVQSIATWKVCLPASKKRVEHSAQETSRPFSSSSVERPSPGRSVSSSCYLTCP